jgi:hypothetical protein
MTGFEIYEFMITETFKTLSKEIRQISIVENNTISTMDTKQFAKWINKRMKQLNTKEN